MTNRLTFTALAAVLAACPASAIASDGTPPTSVVIKGVRNPVLQPYRIMAAGFKAMEKNRSLAPSVSELTFRFSTRTGAPARILDGLTLRLEGPQTDLAVPVDADGVFTLPRSESASSDNAKLVLNRPQTYIRWLPQVRTPGVPAGYVRLGDARMECQVLVAIVKKVGNFGIVIALNGLLRTSEWCSAEEFALPSFTRQPVASATLLHKGQRIPLKVEDDGSGFAAPIRDPRYGNDDLIEVTYASGKPGA